MFKTSKDRLSEIKIYELVAEELEQGKQSKGLWVKALAESDGDPEKTKARYIDLRVRMLKDEWASAEQERKILEHQSQLPSPAMEERAEERIRGANQEDNESMVFGGIGILVVIGLIMALVIWIAK